MKISNPVFIILGILFCFGQAFAINQYKHFALGRWDLQSQVYYQKSKTNFNTSGNITDLAGSNYYQIMDILSGARYGVSDSMNIYGGFNVGNAESYNSVLTRTNSSVNKLMAGAEYMMWNDFPQVIPEFYVLADLEKISDNQDNVINSEGASEMTGKVNLQYDFNSLYLFGYVGYSYRDKGRSSLLPWSANAEWAFSGSSLGGELFGFQSISDDKDKGSGTEAIRDALRLKVDGGSARFYATNPSIVDSNIYLKFGLGREWTMWVAAGIPLIGKNYSNGFHGETGLRWSFGGDGAKRERAHRRAISVPVDEGSRISTDKKVEKFKEDTNDGVDQRLFKPAPTPVVKKPKSAYTPTAPPPPDLQEKMDDVEMKIELRSNKKKKKKTTL